MVKRKVSITTMEEANEFNKLCSKFTCDMDLVSGKYCVDAKSIMGIFSLNLNNTLELIANMDDEAKIDETFAHFIQK